MPLLPRSRAQLTWLLGGVSIAVLSATLVSALWHEPATVQASSPLSRDDIGCAVDVGYPLGIGIEMSGTALPGGRVTFTVNATSDLALENATIRLRPGQGLALNKPPETPGRGLPRGGRLTEQWTVRLPNDRQRRVIEVVFEGTVDGVPLRRAAAVNLNPGGPEPGRVVVTPDGRQVREVRGEVRR